MDRSGCESRAFVISILLLATTAWAQSALNQAAAPSNQAANQRQLILAAARDIMQSSRYCAVITVDDSGRPQARTVDPFLPEADMTVWFATNPKSRKVAQLRKDPRVTLYYFSPQSAELGYVTLFGHARLVDDRTEKQKRWKPEWSGLWRDRDASYLLVEVTAEKLEVVSPKHGISGDPVTWTPPALNLKDRTQK